MATMDVVTGVALREAPQTLDIVTGVTVSTSASTTRDVVTSVLVISGPLEPFWTVKLPPGPWTQTAGPAAGAPNALMPGKPSPGTSVSYAQPNGTSVTLQVLPHTIFGHNADGLYPIRRRPSPITPDPGTGGFGTGAFGTSPFGT